MNKDLSIIEKKEKKIEDFKKNIDEFFNFFEGNIKRYKTSMRFAFKETLNADGRRKLRKQKKPVIEINYIQSYLSRLLGEFSKQTPEVKVRGANTDIEQISPQSIGTTKAVENIMREIFFQYEKSGNKNHVIKEQCGGGYSVLKVETGYKNEDTFDQEIKVVKSEDPTMCFFDPMAKKASKSDGQYCGQIFPMQLDAFKAKYPKHASKADDMRNGEQDTANVKWSYKNMTKEIFLVADYYCVESTPKKLVLLSDGRSMRKEEYEKLISSENYSELGPAPTIAKERISSEKVIKRYVLFGADILDEEETSLVGLPYIFVDGDSAFVYKNNSSSEVEQVVRSYIHNAMDAQKMLNYICQTIANFSENLMQQKHIIDERAIVDAYSWTNPQQVSVLMKKSVDERGEIIPNPVQEVHQQDLPASVMNTFSSMQNVMQNTLGSYDAMLGINEKDLSGIAIQEGATQNNAVAMPFINGYLDAINTVSEMIVKMLPKYWKTPMTIPVIDMKNERSYLKINQIMSDGSPFPGSVQLDYGDNDLEVEVSSGYNFTIQNDKALKTVILLTKEIPAFNKLVNEKGLQFILDLLEIRGVEQLKEMAKEEQESEQQQKNQPSPEEQMMMLKQQELQLKAQKIQMDYKLKQDQLADDKQIAMINLNKELINASVQNEKVQAEIQTTNVDAAAKVANEIIAHEEHRLRRDDQDHKHTMDVMRG